MTIHVLSPVQQEADTSDGSPPETAYDSVWAGAEDVPGATAQQMPVAESDGFEQTMLSNDKLYVVLAVVLLVWLGLAILLFRTDRRLTVLERRLDEE